MTRQDGLRDHFNQNYQRWYKFRVDEEMFEEMKAEQDNCCAICGDPQGTPKSDRYRGTAELNIDHCHETGLVRGLLCSDCNKAIGLFQENIDILRKAVWYLEPIE